MKEFLQLVSPYLGSAADNLEACLPYISEQQYEKNAYIHRAGEVCDEMFYITDGLVRCYYLYEDREINLRLLCEPSAAIALTSFVERQPSREFIQCMSDARGYRVRMRQMLDEVPGITGERIARIVAERHYLSMERRLLTLQRKSAAERYAYFKAQVEPRIVHETPGYHIASYLGITPEAFSRIKASS